VIIPDKKKMATAIVAQMGSGGEEVAEADGDAHEALAEEIISAVKSGSAAALADALKAFYAECSEYE
jgi:hypothetical protein